MSSQPHAHSSTKLLLSILALLLITIVAPQALAQGRGKNRVERDGTVMEVSEMTRAVTANGTAQADCLGAGSLVPGSVNLVNSGAAQSVNLTISLPAGLVAVPGSCVASFGVCLAVNPSTFAYTANLAAGQTVTIEFLTQIGNLVLPETTLCLSFTAQFGGGTTITVQSCVTTTCPLAGPGLPFGGFNEPSDQKAGSVLVYNLYTSSASAPTAQNTRISITNTDPSRGIGVHLFFIDGSSCSVADRYICLTPNQTMTFLTSEQDPATTGYLIAVAADVRLGCPITFNHLIGDLFVKFATGHAANLGAEAIAGIAGGIPFCNPFAVTARLNFDGVSYGLLPRVLASSSIPSRADGNDTLIVLNSMVGALTTTVGNIGPIFGIVYDDAEQPQSFTFAASCQLRAVLSNAFPRLTPRFEVVIPAGQTGWMKLWATNDNPILGAQINFNPNTAASAGAFSQGHNLHKLKLSSSGVLVIPIFPPNC